MRHERSRSRDSEECTHDEPEFGGAFPDRHACKKKVGSVGARDGERASELEDPVFKDEKR